MSRYYLRFTKTGEYCGKVPDAWRIGLKYPMYSYFYSLHTHCWYQNHPQDFIVLDAQQVPAAIRAQALLLT